MRLLFVADGRSPIAQNWIRHWAERGDEVYLASTFACEADFPLKGLEFIPVAFSGTKRPASTSGAASARTLRQPLDPLMGTGRLLGLRMGIRQWLGPLTIPRAARRLRARIEQIKPDLVHALRIPYEGMLAADAYSGVPLVISIWGNDFTLHAPSTPLMRHYTAWTVKVADALHADSRRDIRLAREWGFDLSQPTLLAPGNGGIRTNIFFPPKKPVEAPVVFNPRGFRAYVRNDTFFRAIPFILQKQPDAKFVCASMAGEAQAIQWIERLKISHAVELLPPLPHAQMADIYRRAQVLVSPSVHDGTPNSLLEGMACGCLPVAGDLESIREWIRPGENGLLVDASDPQALADAVIEGLKNKDLRKQAAGLNQRLITERAEYARCMARAESFYKRVTGAS